MEKLFALLAKTYAESSADRHWFWAFSGNDKSIHIKLYDKWGNAKKPLEAALWINTKPGIEAACKFISDNLKNA